MIVFLYNILSTSISHYAPKTQSSIKACAQRTLTQSHFVTHPIILSQINHQQIAMKTFTVAVMAMVICTVAAFPQKDGQVFSNEAIRQAQNTYLIPKDATIQKVQEGIELAAYESIPGDQRINLFEILGDHVPPEVVNNLQGQIDQIGRN